MGTTATTLVSNALGAALTLETDSLDRSATPLRLQAEMGGRAPMKVNSETRVDSPS